MNLLKTFAAASAIALASFSASAYDITSGGVTWDPDQDGLFDADFFALSKYIGDGAGNGFGLVTEINGNSEYCAADCQLSYAYSNLANGGELNFYVIAEDSVSNFATASAGSLWLSLAANDHADASTTSSLHYTAYFDVQEIVGTVWSNFDTNTLDGADVAITGGTITDFGIGGATFHGDSIPEPTTLAIFGLGLLGLARSRKA